MHKAQYSLFKINVDGKRLADEETAWNDQMKEVFKFSVRFISF